MATVDVSPESLHAAGDDLRVLREDVVSNRHVHLLHGYDDHQYFSTGGFEMGVLCQMRLNSLYDGAQRAFVDAFQNMVALCSALHIVADLYYDSDHKDAMLFAFLEAEAPTDLPSHIDETRNSRTYAEQYETQQALAGGGVPTNWNRDSYYITTGIRYTVVKDADGVLMGYSYEYLNADGHWVTEMFNGNREAVSTVVVDNAAGVTRTYNGAADPENLVREDYKVVDETGTHYQVDVYDEDGNATTTTQYDVGPEETEPVPRGAPIRQSVEEMNQLNDDALSRARAGGVVADGGEYGEIPYEDWYMHGPGTDVDQYEDDNADWEYTGPSTR